MAAVTVAQCQQYLRISAGTEDDLVEILCDSAEDFIEEQAGVGLTNEEHVEYLDGSGNALVPSYYPVTAVSEVYDMEEDAAEDTDDYYLRGNWLIRCDGGGRWAEGNEQLGRGRYKVTYTGGYSTVPGRVKLVILQLVARAYHNRAGAAAESAAGHNVTFQEWENADVMQLLRSLKPGGGFIG